MSSTFEGSSSNVVAYVDFTTFKDVIHDKVDKSSVKSE